ncbi:uncharacterized protein LOC116573985 [Mustela erminea]|uniref:uncharacterized protein LOC116573985 n=1 Tax=Mustela erminea TaxID=36723 RepID=UPI00138732CA|nr:uncharacterized protein LOC116573985 [Mustela erminea]
MWKPCHHKSLSFFFSRSSFPSARALGFAACFAPTLQAQPLILPRPGHPSLPAPPPAACASVTPLTCLSIGYRPFPSPASAPRSGDSTARSLGLWALPCEHTGMRGSTRGWGSCAPAPPQNVASPPVQSSHEKTRRREAGVHTDRVRLALSSRPPARSLPRSAAETRGHTRERPMRQRGSAATVSPEKGQKAEAEDNEGTRKERGRVCLQSYLNSCTAFLASPCCHGPGGCRNAFWNLPSPAAPHCPEVCTPLAVLY